MLKYKIQATLSDNSVHNFDVSARSEKEALSFANSTIDEVLSSLKNERTPISVQANEEYIDEM